MTQSREPISDPTPNTELGVNLERRRDESWEDYTDRIAVDTYYAAKERLRAAAEARIAEAIAAVLRLVYAERYNA